MRTDAGLEVASAALADEASPLCDGCSICLDVCPVKILEPYRLTDISSCLSNISRLNHEGRSILCDECVKLWPAASKKINSDISRPSATAFY
jgi:ferredoxin